MLLIGTPLLISLVCLGIGFLAMRWLVSGYEQEVKIPEGRPKIEPIRKVAPKFLDEEEIISEAKAKREKGIPSPEATSSPVTTTRRVRKIPPRSKVTPNPPARVRKPRRLKITPEGRSSTPSYKPKKTTNPSMSPTIETTPQPVAKTTKKPPGGQKELTIPIPPPEELAPPPPDKQKE
jgi:hypothetical protein